MAGFTRSRDRKDRGNSPRNSGSFKDFSRGRRDNSRDSSRNRGKRNFTMTKVTCSECGKQCEVPFKPTSDKPIYCSDCFSKKEKSNNQGVDLSEINEKLDKIMDALNIN